MMQTERPANHRLARYVVAAILTTCFLLGLIWRFSAWHDRFGVETLTQWAQQIQGHPATPLFVIAIYIAGGLLFFVHAALLWATVFTFDPWHAFMYAEIGSLSSALVV